MKIERFASRSQIALVGTVLLGLSSCDRDGRDLLPPNNEDYPAVEEYGEVQILTSAQFDEFSAADDQVAWCAEEDDEGRPRCLFPMLSNPEAGVTGGATFTFEGTGSSVCVLADPEAVFWGLSIAPSGRVDRFSYPDNYNDDGDIDLFGGLSSYYTGSPGVELGDFKGFYTDSSGREIEIEYAECTQTGYLGQDDAHAGRGTVEYCDINTDEREGVHYTIVAQTFSVPLDDGLLSFGAMVVEGRCSQKAIDECTVLGESLDEDVNERSCSRALELAHCNNLNLEYCCANPEMCGEPDIDDDVCGDFDRDAFCGEHPYACCGD